MAQEKPWLKFFEGISDEVVTPDATLYQTIAHSAAATPDAIAFIYLGRTVRFAEFLQEVDFAAAAFAAYGITARDAVILSLPNVPAVVFAFYALNKIGAYAVMTHPQSSPDELRHYIRLTDARWAVTLDRFYPIFANLARETGLERIVLGRASDYLSWSLKLGFALTKGRTIPRVSADPRRLWWKDLRTTGMASLESAGAYSRPIEPEDGCVVLFSGGTTDLPKGIELTSANFNALAASISAVTGLKAGDSVLAILPAFHGFGLGLAIHTTLAQGAYFILVPEFSPEIYIDNVIKYEPSFIAGMPTLFQALMSHPKFPKARFDKLKGAYSGGDMLSAGLKRRFDAAIQAQGASVEVMEGYGLTECVTACSISPRHHYRDNSMGIPLPGMDIKVVDPVSGQDVAPGVEGEFCIAGPTLMKGYVKDPEATAEALRPDAQGRIWLHSGDLGLMDAAGYLYFRGRSKRLIKVSGVSVYPVQVEQVLESHPLVDRACVIGVPDDYQMSRVKAFVVLADGVANDEEVRVQLRTYCKEHLIKWAVPREIEFRLSLPTTRVGKIAYTELEREAVAAGKN